MPVNRGTPGLFVVLMGSSEPGKLTRLETARKFADAAGGSSQG